MNKSMRVVFPYTHSAGSIMSNAAVLTDDIVCYESSLL